MMLSNQGEYENIKKHILFNNGSSHSNIGYNDMCQKTPPHHIRIAYNNEEKFFKLDNNTQQMVQIPVYPTQVYSQISWDWEILENFFDKLNIKPTWTYSNQVWGVLNKESNSWTGSVGKVCRMFSLWDNHFHRFSWKEMKLTLQSEILPVPMREAKLFCVHPHWNMFLTIGFQDFPIQLPKCGIL